MKPDLDLDRLAYETLVDKAKTKSIWKDGVFLPEEYNRIADAVENFEVRDDDVWVCSFQKSGTTWTQEMVWGVTHDADLETTKTYLNERFPFLEFTGIIITARVAMRENHPDLERWIYDSVNYCKDLPAPRHIKCHLPFNLLPRQIRTGEKKPKIVYVARNPKDVCVSFYHHSLLLEGYCGNFQQFCELFLGDRLNYAPYWNHVLGFWEKSKGMDNIMFIRFEDMKTNLPDVIRKTAAFYGKQLSDSQVNKLAEHLSFASMKKNPSLNKERTVEIISEMKVFGEHRPKGEFIRNGTVGQWKEKMSDETIARFNKWIADNLKNHLDYKV
ncbi:luciferin sulfotransferase-like [Phymastichus coffea]|uniref:luciferin sulfotransferase-like n=1 Tax=Phymastichus coffea TaxID=108790 RepID=UPI00273C9AFE|nr:luciferin sulfotransferase-like [Phymastichus coffea]